ncbi:MAG: hypothetical protein PHG40_03985 [Candidatus Omnitrophica bacterium]|nr:hypothetical protein [Candidatus Omnitrophota bacterium]
MIEKYQLEFILHSYDASPQTVKSALSEFGRGLEVIEVSGEDNSKGRDFKVNVRTEDPTVIFDLCAQLGRIRTVKINEGE